FTDGTSTTIAFGEVRKYGPYLRDSGNPAQIGAAIPTTPAEVAAFGGVLRAEGTDADGSDATAHNSAITFVFTPNTDVTVVYQGQTYHNVGFVSMREGTSATSPTYAALTSRSYHTGLVNVLM